MNIQAICAVIMCAVAVGGMLVYIGKSLNTLTQVADGLKFMYTKTDRHELEIARIDKELVKISTKQEDCEKCP